MESRAWSRKFATYWEDACHLSVKQAGHATEHDHTHEGGDSEESQLMSSGKLFLSVEAQQKPVRLVL